MILNTFILGLFIGSFLGVVIDRLPRNQSVIKGRSYCDSCKHNLGFLDLIPVLSFVLLKGKCRYCKHRLSYFYPGIEILTGVLFALTWFFVFTSFTVLSFNFLVYFTYLLLMASSFIVIFFIDLKHKIIPDKILIFCLIITIIWLFFNPVSLIINHILSGIGAILFFLVVSFLFYFVTKKDGLGGGDIKLAFILGLFLGFPGIFFSLYLSFVIGALAGLVLLLWGKKKMQSALAFGPFLIIGALISLYFQSQIGYIFFRVFGILL